MTRAQIEAARERVAEVLTRYLGSGERNALCSDLVTAVLGHPDGKVPRAKQPGRGTRLRFAR